MSTSDLPAIVLLIIAHLLYAGIAIPKVARIVDTLWPNLKDSK